MGIVVLFQLIYFCSILNTTDDFIKSNIHLDLSQLRNTESPTMLSYLDILITIENKKYLTTMFDKRQFWF